MTHRTAAALVAGLWVAGAASVAAADETTRAGSPSQAAAGKPRFVRPPIVVYADGNDGDHRHWSYLIFGRLDRTPALVGATGWRISMTTPYTLNGSGSASPTRVDSRRHCFMDFASDDPHLKLRVRRPFAGRRVTLTTEVDGTAFRTRVRLQHDERIVDDIWATRHYGRLLGCHVA